MLAALACVYEAFPRLTLSQYLIVLEVSRADRDGAPHTIGSLVKKLKMPFSTLSRTVWSLTEEGGNIGVIRYQNHPTDRRKKQLAFQKRSFSIQMSRAATCAMVDYYGDSLRHLKRAE